MDEIRDKDKNKDCSEDIQLQWHCLEHKGTDKCQKECFFQELLSMFGKKNTLQIIRTLLIHKKMRFNNLLKTLGGSPKTLTVRLKELEKRGLIHREVFNEIPIRVEYSLTEAGLDLSPLFEKITDWIRKWMADISL